MATRVFPDGELADAAELGAVTDRSVRVWVHQPGLGELAGELRVAGRAPVVARLALDAEHDWTGALVFELPVPAPGAEFACVVGAHTLHGRLAPTPGVPASLTFGFGSCHMPFGAQDGRIVTRPDALIYRRMRGELTRAGADFLLLGGDQLYADLLPGLSVRDDLPDNAATATALAAYRRLYRGFFNQRDMRALRAALPTLCMWDDHDIFDNWGSSRVKTPLDMTLFAAATRAYREYQQPRNPPSPLPGPPFPWSHVHGDIGLVALDLRGARDAAQGTMLGAAQWDWLRGYLAGDATRLSTLFVVCSVPIGHVSRWFTELFDRAPTRGSGAVRDRWSAAAFLHSRDTLLDELCNWQAAAPARQVVLLSGDVHAASAYTIERRDGAGVIQQWTSSAFTTPLVWQQEFFNHVVTRAPNLFEPRWHFTRHFVSITHNVGVVRAEPLPGGGHCLTFTLRAWQPRTRTLRTAGRSVTTPATRG